MKAANDIFRQNNATVKRYPEVYIVVYVGQYITTLIHILFRSPDINLISTRELEQILYFSIYVCDTFLTDTYFGKVIIKNLIKRGGNLGLRSFEIIFLHA